MLFAATDYIAYLLRKGPYSHAAMIRQGAALATQDNFPHLNACHPGDIFFYHTRRSIISWMIMYFTDSIWSHTGCFVGNGRIIDATTSGVIEHPIADYCDGNGYMSIASVRDITEVQRQAMVGFMRRQVGARFNWVGVIRLFLSIISGAHAHYRARYMIDILLSSMGCIVAFFWYQPAQVLISCAAILYVLVVLANTPRRRAMRTILSNQSRPEMCKAETQHPGRLRSALER